MDSTLAQEIITKTLSFSAADETEVLLTHSEENLTRFSDNIITQNVARLTDSLTVKVHCGKKVGRAGVNQFDDDTLRRSVETAQKIACQQRDTPDLLPLLGPTQFAKTDAFTEATAVYGPEERAKVVRRLVTEAEKHHASAAGIFSNGWDAVALGNSKGLFGYHRASKAIFSATVEIGGQPGWAEDIQQDVNRIEVESVIAASIHKAEQARNPITMPPGEYTVVLEPAAVTDFLMFMAFEGFGGLNYAEGRSFLSGKLGEKVLGDNITIVDDAYDAMNPGLPFDFEGVPRQKLILIEHGIARQVAHDRYTAKQANAETTGHSLPQPNSTGAFPLNVLMEGGDSNFEEMIRTTEKGILVTHFHYTNVLDPIKLILTGMTRDGTFLIEDGRVRHAIRNLRFTESAVEAFQRVELISRERKTADAFFAGRFVAPAIKISKFNFTSISEF